MLTAENYEKGLLVDDQWMGGVAAHPSLTGKFVAFVIDHTEGALVAETTYPTLADAVCALNAIARPWHWEKTGGCGDGNCKGGKCGGAGCHKKEARDSARSTAGTELGF